MNHDDLSHCPRCGDGMIATSGKHGPFYSCASYPSCKGTRPAHVRGVLCPDCGGPMCVKRGIRGAFHSCCRYPECTGTRSIETPQPTVSTAPSTRRYAAQRQAAPVRRTLGEVPDFLNALRVALGVMGEAWRSALLAAANSPAEGRSRIRPHELVEIVMAGKKVAR